MNIMGWFIPTVEGNKMTEEDSDCSKKGMGAPSAAHVPDGNSVDTVTNEKLQAVQIPEAAAIQEASRTPTRASPWLVLAGDEHILAKEERRTAQKNLEGTSSSSSCCSLSVDTATRRTVRAFARLVLKIQKTRISLYPYLKIILFLLPYITLFIIVNYVLLLVKTIQI